MHKEIDIDLMRKCISSIEGKHDFTTFRSAHCQSDSPIKTIDSLQITKSDENIYFGFSAKSFLHHQVRSIVGFFKLFGEQRFFVILNPSASRQFICSFTDLYSLKRVSGVSKTRSERLVNLSFFFRSIQLCFSA